MDCWTSVRPGVWARRGTASLRNGRRVTDEYEPPGDRAGCEPPHRTPSPTNPSPARGLVTVDSGNLTPMTQSRTAQSTGVNALAVVALIFAFVFAPLGSVLGHVARRQINQTGQRGGGSAAAALVIGYCAPRTLLPPSTTSIWPVMYEAAGEHRNVIVAATSSGVPGRPMGVPKPCLSSTSVDAPVWMIPGATALTVMPSATSSMASARVSPTTPALAAAYPASAGRALTGPAVAAKLTMRPQPCSAMPPTKARLTRNAVLRLRSISARHSS